MLRITKVATIAIVAGLLAAPAQAGWNIFEGIARDFKRNNCWYEPFVQADRAAVRAPFAVMVQNGQRLNNTLGEEHFQPGDAGLNRAGEKKVRDVLANSPAQDRTLYVLRADTPELTIARIGAVQAAASRRAPGEAPQVVETGRAPLGSPALEVNATNLRYQSTIPDPRLPEATAVSASGGN